MNGDSSDPLGLVSAARRIAAAFEGSGQVVLGFSLLAAGLLVIGLQSPAGVAAVRGGGKLGRLALEVIPQTRALGGALAVLK